MHVKGKKPAGLSGGLGPAVLVALLVLIPSATSFGEKGGEGVRGKLTPPNKPVRALQVVKFDADSFAEVDRRLADFKKAGVDAIILRVFHNRGDAYYGFVEPRYDRGVYFKTREAPVVADVLGPVINLARRRGLLVIAWMTSRYANYGREQETALTCMAWDFGRNEAVPARGYSPLLPKARDRIAAVYADLARYPIDGVLIQDDLILRHTEGMNPAARALYEKSTGRKADPGLFFKDLVKTGSGYRVGRYTDEFDKWCRWKNAGLVSLAERIRSEVQARRPGAPVGMNLYYESLTAPHHALSWYAQDLSATLDSDLDFYALMLYHRQMASELRLSRDEVFDLIDASLADMARRVDYIQRIWVKAQSVDWDTGARIPPSEIARLLGRSRRHGPVGLVVMPAHGSLDLAALKEIFR